jgi:hypothetical protein
LVEIEALRTASGGSSDIPWLIGNMKNGAQGRRFFTELKARQPDAERGGISRTIECWRAQGVSGAG